MVPPVPSANPRHPPPLATSPPPPLPPPGYSTSFILHLLLLLFPSDSLSYYRTRTRVSGARAHASIPFHMHADRPSMCVSAGEGGREVKGENARIRGRENRGGRNEREKGKTHTGRSRIGTRGRVERRVRRNDGGGREVRDRAREGTVDGEQGGGWPFDEHGGPSMDVRRGPWRHTCTSPRHPGESKQPYKVAGLRFNPKFISSISKGLSRGSERE